VPDDWDALFAVASDPKIWEQHPAWDRYQEAVFRNFFREALDSRGCLVATDRDTGAVIGSSRFNDYDPAKREIEIGWTFLACRYWGRGYNAQMKRLMLDHAFQSVDRVIFRVGTTNIRSQKAMQNIGGILTDRRSTILLNGTPIEHVVFEIRKPH
jgi:RimJ/RimL family protein N-acetyltransferase